MIETFFFAKAGEAADARLSEAPQTAKKPLNTAKFNMLGLQTKPMDHRQAPRKATSKIWKHFQQIFTDNKICYKTAYCNLCHTNVCYAGSTTNLGKHLQHKHIEQYEKLYGSEALQLKISNFNRNLSDNQVEMIHRYIAKMLIKKLYPLSLVDCDEFRVLLHTLNPGKVLFNYIETK